MNKISTNVIHPLQTKYWADFRKAWGNEVVKFNFGYITLHKIPFTPYKVGMFIKGPKPTQEMLDELKKFGIENKVIFIKLEPNYPFEKSVEQILKKNNLVKGKTLFTPTTFVIDLSKNEEELLSSFSSKTRYNIRLAQKHGVKVTEDNSDTAFKRYLALTKETTERQGFYAHTPAYHKLMWKYLNTDLIKDKKEPIAHLLTATYKGEIITTWILFCYDGVLYYPYGASSFKYKNVMANNLMMWEAIKLGKKLGCMSFDLWGREEGKGFTKFKEGYNPKVVTFLGTWDLIINKPLYGLYKIGERVRWIFLKLRTKIFLLKPKF